MAVDVDHQRPRRHVAEGAPDRRGAPTRRPGDLHAGSDAEPRLLDASSRACRQLHVAEAVAPEHLRPHAARRHLGTRHDRRRDAGRDRSRVPRSSKRPPSASRAAAGANTSRPSKVAAAPECAGSATAATAPSAAAAGPSSPLSGPTSAPPPASRTASPRRAVPTPGSTTARCTAAGSQPRQALEDDRAEADVTAGDVVGKIHAHDARVGGRPGPRAARRRARCADRSRSAG